MLFFYFLSKQKKTTKIQRMFVGDDVNLKKILFVISSYTSGGGAESLLTTVVNNLNPLKYKIDIIELLHRDIKKEPTNSNITVLPYIMRADDPDRKRKMYYVYHEPEKVFNAFIKQQYDLYISWNYQRPSFLLPPGKKNIMWIHSDVYDLSSTNMTEERALQDSAFDNAKKIVAISDITMQSLHDLFPKHKDKFVELHNGIDINNVVNRSHCSTNIVLQKPAIICVARFEERKGQSRLLKVFEKALKDRPDMHLYYLGYGKTEDEIKNEVKKQGLDSSVHFLGYIDNPFPVMLQSDVSCLLSTSEGFPMCLLESQALGKPIVATIVGGTKILIQDDLCGSIIKTDDEAVGAILRLINTDENIIKQACKNSIARFSLDKYVKRIENLFDAVLE